MRPGGRPRPLALRVAARGAHAATARELFVYAALFGTVAGLSEALYLTGRQLATGLLASGYHVEVLWMAPLAGAITFVGLAALVIAAGACLGRRIELTTSTWVFAFLAVYGVVQSPGIPLYWQAEVIASLGVAAVVARLVSARATAITAGLRRARVLLAGVWAILLAFAFVRLPGTAERHALADLPEARAGLPNVVLIILDTVRAANLGLYGYARPTSPELSRWAEEGVVFERAYSTAPWTLPSHATLFTGRYPYETRTGIVRPLGTDAPTLAEALAGQGYATAGFVANLLYTTPTSGLDRGFARYEAHDVSLARVARSYWLPRSIESVVRRRRGLSTVIVKDGRIVTDDFLAWLDDRDDRPFFAFLNYFDAHDPYEPPEPWRSLFGPGPDEPWRPEMVNLWGRTDSAARIIDQFEQRYDGGIAYVDHQLGIVRRRLEADGLLDETIVVITSDHGEAWGENGQLGHLNALYVPLLHVPLFISYPGHLPEGRRAIAPVTLRDLPATILDLVGSGDGAPLPGSSLVAAMSVGGATTSASPVLAELYAYQRESKGALFEGDLHYLDFGDGREVLYDLRTDPSEEHDLSSDPSRAEALARFRAALRRLGAVPGPRTLDEAERPPR